MVGNCSLASVDSRVKELGLWSGVHKRSLMMGLMDGEASSDGEEWGFGEVEGSSKDGKKIDGMIFEDDGE
ncbi:hypothetical protein V6N12_007583 [Hibiscus sabdariffa]|uniref:Uncharacterized protein n=1 Tax=Hibiscus sabdariffa TaxID=183260 RepID=A0ABR2F270_9ROSI